MIRQGPTGPYRLVGGVREPVQLCFAYGMNLDPDYMRGCEPVGAATLHGWELFFSGLASVRERDGESVPGAVWALTDRQLMWLDGREGYRGDETNYYDRTVVPVELDDGSVVSAWVYHMREPEDERERDMRLAPSAPPASYADIIRRGYAAFGLPIHALERAIADAYWADPASAYGGGSHA